jgi:cysteine-rich repeat protein
VDNGPNFACLAECTLNVCGDGFEGPNEGCDDGNTVGGDGCSATCTLEVIPPGAVLCGNKIYQCGDTIDNDMDGKIDLADPECISACDDDEATFKTNLPGQNKPCMSDCYFDVNSGPGDDDCTWNLKCDSESPGAQLGCPYNPNQMCEPKQSQACLDFCLPLVPSGCDCFGCCEIAGQYIYLAGAACALDTIDTCETCTPNQFCHNM